MAEWKNLMRAAARDLRIGGRIVFGSGMECALDSDMVISLVIEEGASGSLQPGSVLCAECSIDLVNDNGQWNAGGAYLGWNEVIGATLMPELGTVSGDETIWQPMGVFEVYAAQRPEGEGMLRLRARDSIAMELSGAFTDGMQYPCTLEALWMHAVGQSRYSFSGTVSNGSGVIGMAPDWKDASLRTALGCIAAAAGCFVRIDRRGALELCPLWNRDGEICAIDPETYLKLEAGEQVYGPLDSLRISWQDSGREKVYSLPAADGMHSLELSENPLFIEGAPGLDGLAAGMLNSIAGFCSEQLRFSWRGDPCLCIGDRLLLTDLDGRQHAAVLTRQTLRLEAGFSADCVCEIPDTGSGGVRRVLTPEGGLNAAALSGPLNGALISAGSVSTDKLAAGSITAEKIAAGALDAAVLEAMIAKVGSLTADDIATDRLAAALAAFTVLAAGTAEFDRATVAHLVSRALNLEFGTMDEVFIRNLSVQYAQMVGAAIGNLVIGASDGNYYQIDVDAQGRVSASAVDVSGEEIAAGQAANGRPILATNIAAESLNTGNLLATYALVNRIDSARIDVDELFAREAFVNLLRTSRIVDEVSIEMIVGDLQDVQALLRLDDAGLHVGDGKNAGEVLIDYSGINVVVNGQRYSRFASNHVQFGNYQLRQSADGGLVFKLKEV